MRELEDFEKQIYETLQERVQLLEYIIADLKRLVEDKIAVDLAIQSVDLIAIQSRVDTLELER